MLQLSLTSVVQPGHNVQLSGAVTGTGNAGVTVTFSGTVSGSTITNSTGNFTYTTSQATLGLVSAVGVNQQQQTTNTATSMITVAMPTLSLSLSYGTQHNITLSGSTTGIDLSGRTISFSGVASGSTTTGSTGGFSLTTQASALGSVTATVTDLWGQTSAPAQVMVMNSAAFINVFTATNQLLNVWHFDGHVNDENAAGLTITFGGLASLAGQTVVVGSDGWFHFTITLQEGETGTATAITTDWWQQLSNEAWALVR